MAKSKKNIDAFSKAMLGNTKMITSDETPSKKSPDTKGKSASKATTAAQVSGIDPGIYAKFQEMGKKHNIDPDQLLTAGLNLFISMEDYWFSE